MRNIFYLFVVLGLFSSCASKVGIKQKYSDENSQLDPKANSNSDSSDSEEEKPLRKGLVVGVYIKKNNFLKYDDLMVLAVEVKSPDGTSKLPEATIASLGSDVSADFEQTLDAASDYVFFYKKIKMSAFLAKIQVAREAKKKRFYKQTQMTHELLKSLRVVAADSIWPSLKNKSGIMSDIKKGLAERKIRNRTKTDIGDADIMVGVIELRAPTS